MRMSHRFGETLRAAPGEGQTAGQGLLLRAGYMLRLAAGVPGSLPLGLRAARKIERIVREEIEAIGGQEIALPAVGPAEPLRESGRDLLPEPAREQEVVDLVRREVHSYRQLPMLIYELRQDSGDESCASAGSAREREFARMDSHSLDVDEAGLERQYRGHYAACLRIFSRVGLAGVLAAPSEPGLTVGEGAHQFLHTILTGDDVLARCGGCGYAAGLQVARFRKPAAPSEELRALEKVATPGARTIRALADLLEIPESRTAKVVFFTAAAPAAEREVLVMALVRGDMEVSEAKLARAIRARRLGPADAEEIRAAGAEPGFASPVGVARDRTLVVVDDLVAASPNLVSGANEADFHYLNVNVGRDYRADLVADIAAAPDSAPCAGCGAPLHHVRGVEVGRIVHLGTRRTEALGATYLDAEGRARPVAMGSCHVMVGRLLACVAEAHHDERGLRLPIAVAPYDAHLVCLGRPGDAALETQASALYAALQEARVETLFDDRDLSAGVKFTDADLIGLPLRVTISRRSLQGGGVEIKRRDRGETRVLPVEEAVSGIRHMIAELHAEARERVAAAAYPVPEAS